MPATDGEPTLHEALAEYGITSEKGNDEFRRRLFKEGKHIGDFSASEGWELVSEMSSLTRRRRLNHLHIS